MKNHKWKGYSIVFYTMELTSNVLIFLMYLSISDVLSIINLFLVQWLRNIYIKKLVFSHLIC